MDFEEYEGNRPESGGMGDDPMVFGEGGGASMDTPDEGFGFDEEKPAPEYNLSDEPGSGASSDDFGFDDAPQESGGTDFSGAAGSGFGDEPIGHSVAGSTSFFGFFGKGLKMALLNGDAAEEVAADPKAFVPALVVFMFPSFVAGLLIALMATAFSSAALSEAGPAAQQMQAFLPLMQKFSISFVVLFPLGALVGTLVYVGILHLLAKLFKGQGGFLDYYQTIGVGSLVSWGGMIPYVGMLFSLWMIPVTVVITSRVHSISTGRAVAVVLIPILIVFILIVALFSTIMMAMMGAASGAGGMQGM